MCAGGDQVGDAGARIVATNEGLPHEDDVRPALGVLDDVVWTAYARLATLTTPSGISGDRRSNVPGRPRGS